MVIKLFYFYRAVLKFHSSDVCVCVYARVKQRRIKDRGGSGEKRELKPRRLQRTNVPGSRVKKCINVSSPSGREFERVGRSYMWGQFTKIIQTPDDRKRVSLSKDSRDFRRERDGRSSIDVVKIRIPTRKK